MISEQTSALLREANEAHRHLLAAIGRSGPITMSGSSSSATNALNWLAEDKSTAEISLALERYVAARACLAMSLRQDYARSQVAYLDKIATLRLLAAVGDQCVLHGEPIIDTRGVRVGLKKAGGNISDAVLDDLVNARLVVREVVIVNGSPRAAYTLTDLGLDQLT